MFYEARLLGSVFTGEVVVGERPGDYLPRLVFVVVVFLHVTRVFLVGVLSVESVVVREGNVCHG